MRTGLRHFRHLEGDECASLNRSNPKARLSAHESLKLHIEVVEILRYHNQGQLQHRA